MRVLIIEDEALAVKRLKNLLLAYDADTQIIEELDSIEDSVEVLSANQDQIDLIFLDIHIADGLSFSIFDQVKVNIPIIFTTAYDQYALEAFKVNSINYLLKPIKESALASSIEKYKELNQKNNSSLDHLNHLIETLNVSSKKYKERFLIKHGDRLIPVQESDIQYIFSKEKLVYLRTNQAKYVLDGTLEDIIKELDPSKFFRLNRQYIARIQSIEKIHFHFNGKLKVNLTPYQEEDIYVSREKSSEFKNWLDQ